MRVHGRLDLWTARLHVGHELQQPAGVVALGEALAPHQPALLQLRRGEQEAVCGDQINPGMVVPAGQEQLEEAGGRGLAHRHRTGDADDEGDPTAAAAQELVGVGVELLGGGDMEVQQPGKRHVDIERLADREGVVEADDAAQIVFGELEPDV